MPASLRQYIFVKGNLKPSVVVVAAHADLGVVIDGSPFFSVSKLQLGVTQSRGALNDGTWGVWLKNGADVLVTRFNVSCVFTQDIAVQVFHGLKSDL